MRIVDVPRLLFHLIVVMCKLLLAWLSGRKVKSIVVGEGRVVLEESA